MKTWEMIKELTEHPEKEFKNQNGEIIAVLPDGDLYLPGNLDNYIGIYDVWEETRESVTWEEAFKAGLEGKKIKPDGQHFTYPDYEELHYALMYLGERPGYYKNLILDKWYIE